MELAERPPLQITGQSLAAKLISLYMSFSLRELEQFLKGGIDAVAVPSVAYGISRGEEILLIGASGLADKDLGVLATVETPYALASITKPMTATGIAILADRGLIDLDAPINEYLGESKVVARVGDAEDATVRRVANHSSGLPLHYQFFYEDEPFRAPEMPETIRRYAKLYSPPGERYQYSNIGYGLLNYVIERVSGRPYAQFMAEEVFTPLGMTRSAIGPPSGAALSYGATDGVPYPRYGFDHPGASEAFASVEDLLKFGRSHLGLGPQILSPKTRLEMLRATMPIEDTWGYGFGWSVNEARLGLRTVGHAGGMSGVNTVLVLLPDLATAIAILINGQGSLPFQGADNAMAALVPAFAEKLAVERAAPTKDEAVPGAPAEFRRSWEGGIETYAGDFPLALEVSKADEATATFGGQQYPVTGIQFRDGRLHGVFDGQIDTPDAMRRPHRIHLDLKLRGNTLGGSAAAISTFEGEGGGAPGNRRGNAVCYWTQLR